MEEGRKFLTEARGFTPVIDVVVAETGLMAATIYGVVWRYCQMEDGVCKASLEKIGNRIGVSYNTTLRHVKSLCEAGYLEDQTPERRNAPHIYADLGRVKIRGLVEAALLEIETGEDIGLQEMESKDDIGLQEMETKDDVGLQEMESKDDAVCRKWRPRSAADGDEDTLKDTIKNQERESPDPKGSGKARFACPRCQLICKSKGGLTRHMRTAHGEDTRHPAVVVYQESSEQRPMKVAREQIIQQVGEDPEDNSLWGRVVSAWILNGWNPLNVGGMLEYFERRQIPKMKGASDRNGNNARGDGPGSREGAGAPAEGTWERQYWEYAGRFERGDPD